MRRLTSATTERVFSSHSLALFTGAPGNATPGSDDVGTVALAAATASSCCRPDSGWRSAGLQPALAQRPAWLTRKPIENRRSAPAVQSRR